MEEMDMYDKLFYHMEEDNPIFSNIIILKLEIDGIIETDVFKEKAKELLIKYPKLCMIVDNMKWKKVDVNTDNHVMEIKDNENINTIINKVINIPFSEDIPKWMVYNIIRSGDKSSFIILKIHHSYGDGDKCTEMMSSISDIKKEPSKAELRNNVNEGYLMKICKSIYYFIVSFCILAHFILFFKKEKVFVEPEKESKAVFCNIYNFNVDELKLKKKEMGITMNDLLYGLILKSIRKYANKDMNLSSSSMINLRRQNDIESTNNFAFAMFSTKVDESNIFTKVHNQMNSYKKVSNNLSH